MSDERIKDLKFSQLLGCNLCGKLLINCASFCLSTEDPHLYCYGCVMKLKNYKTKKL